jgi:hypothetical protein
VNLPLIEGILRHAQPATTAIDLQRANPALRTAQCKFLEAINVTKVTE